MITVMKFGGTSVGSAEAMKRVAKIIAEKDGDRVVVVSAMAGITNALVAAHDNEKMDPEKICNEFRKVHLKVAKELFDDVIMSKFMLEFEERFVALKKLLQISKNRRNAFYKDNLSSQGERFSSLILSYLLVQMGYKSKAFTSEGAGIYAMGKPLFGYCDLKKTTSGLRKNVKPLLKKGVIPIITGFYGINLDGRPLTFGRGGSDYAAAAVGYGLDADVVEIWTDVDGFMTADPRVVKTAKNIPEMSFEEAAELAHFGAKVLHPRTIEPARMKGIAVVIKNSYNPKHPGTIIHNIGENTEYLEGVAMKKNLNIVTVHAGEIAYKPNIVSTIIEQIGEIDVILYGISTSLSTLALLVDDGDLKKTTECLNGLKPIGIEKIIVKKDVALICTVGRNLLKRNGYSGDVFETIKKANINVEMISEGASNVSLNFVVPEKDAVEAVKALHKKLVDGVKS